MRRSQWRAGDIELRHGIEGLAVDLVQRHEPNITPGFGAECHGGRRLGGAKTTRLHRAAPSSLVAAHVELVIFYHAVLVVVLAWRVAHAGERIAASEIDYELVRRLGLRVRVLRMPKGGVRIVEGVRGVAIFGLGFFAVCGDERPASV